MARLSKLIGALLHIERESPDRREVWIEIDPDPPEGLEYGVSAKITQVLEEDNRVIIRGVHTK